ncbi:MAG: nucleotide sugar dehydrogenase [Bacteroidales bacterium]|nr:nucleotide sugar dehydrogenase [Bacteroidales bacterium]
MKAELIAKFTSRQARVAVVGLGYVGLPLAVVFAEAGFNITGIDVDLEKMQALNRGESYIQDIPTDRVAPLVESGALSGTTDFQVLKEMDAVSVCVPTPLRKTGDPDLSYIVSAVEDMKAYVHPGMVVVLESTTYPGSTREILLPILTGDNVLEVGENFFLAFSPERVDPGREDWTTENTPKVVGGITADCTEVIAAWYGAALDTVVPVSSTEVAEMSKLLENTFRMINIGLVNEMALMCDRLEIDVWEVIEAAATKPFGYMKFTPGPGLGGHCIPIDPLYLSWKLRGLHYNTRFINLASEINANMPRYVVSKVQDALNQREKPLKGSRVLVLGAAYKPDVDDLRESPALDVIGLLREKGAEVRFHDPYIPKVRHDGWNLHSVGDLLSEVEDADCVVMVTDHSSYDMQAVYQAASLIVDTRNAFGGISDQGKKIYSL